MPVDISSIASRRDFLKSSSLAAAAGFLLPSLMEAKAKAAEGQKLRVAAICTVMHHRSHAHVILENFLQDYLFNGERTSPGVEIVSIYFDQRLPEGVDIVDAVLEQHPIPLYKTIGEALCLGGDKLAVDAILNIGEHGDYAQNHLDQKMYPRKRFFDEAVAVMKRSNRYVPIFNDKHLSYSWEYAKEMYDTAQQYGIPLMAGSSVPSLSDVPAGT
ncbi:MAG: twin-arginine translocation signal domain-containing protein [Planctomycetaceae bacterium]